MPTFVTLLNYTAEGVQHMDESPDRLDAAREVVESMGGELHDFYLTMGRYDAVVIVEMPDAASAARAVMTVAGSGAITTETLRAFPEDEYRELIDGLA